MGSFREDLGSLCDQAVWLLREHLPFTPYQQFARGRLSTLPWGADGFDIVRIRAFSGGEDLYRLRIGPDEDLEWHRWRLRGCADIDPPGEGEPVFMFHRAWCRRHVEGAGAQRALLDMVREALDQQVFRDDLCDGDRFEVRVRVGGRLRRGVFADRGGDLVMDLIHRLEHDTPLPRPEPRPDLRPDLRIVSRNGAPAAGP